MDRKTVFAKLSPLVTKAKKLFVLTLLIAGVWFTGAWAFKQKTIKDSVYKAVNLKDTVTTAWTDAQKKVEALRYADLENHRLKTENLNLRKSTEDLKFDCRMTQAKEHTHEISRSLANDTGSKVGRVLASIEYRPPTHLLPEQVFTLGVTYFKGKEHEKSAVILSYLTGLDEDESFKTPENFLMTAVSWYRLDHLKLADHYLDKIFDFPSNAKTKPMHAQARLWKALVAKRLSKEGTSQGWLRELLDYHPHSLESAWVNGTENALKARPAKEVHAVLETDHGKKGLVRGIASTSPSEHAQADNGEVAPVNPEFPQDAVPVPPPGNAQGLPPADEHGQEPPVAHENHEPHGDQGNSHEEPPQH